MIEFIRQLVDFVMNIDKYLIDIVTEYNTWTYLFLCVILFSETGLVIFPILPGDSLLFATGAVSAMEGNPLNIAVVIPLLLMSVFLGDNTNYFLGRYLGQKVYEKDYKLIKRKYLDKTKEFYEKHGGKTLIFARFMPIIRTFAPFVAGVGKMKYRRFLLFCIAGSVFWVNLFCLAGYFFGNIPFVKKNFSVIIIAIIMTSLIPPIYVALKNKLFNRKNKIRPE